MPSGRNKHEQKEGSHRKRREISEGFAQQSALSNSPTAKVEKMGVSEEDVKEEEQIQEDFKKAKEIYQRIVKQFSNKADAELPTTLFALCLIYARLLKHRRG